ncbi:MAG TPA: choice-of-anchor D domain-containing protein [Caldimonas sp.]|nr:choice-of-anchor D domain-containing protein [Caldimonas sp.]
MGTYARSAPRGGAAAVLSAAAFVLGTLGSGAAHAQAPAYFVPTCSAGCHGNPAKISDGVVPDDDRPLTTINVSSATPVGSGTDWLRNDGAFATHISGINATMDTLAAEGTSTNRDAVRAYLQNLRDGRISTAALNFASTNIGASRSLNFTLTNDRFLTASFSVSKSGTNTADFTVTGCGLNGAGNNGSIPASGTAVAGSCTVSVQFSPLAGASTSRTANLLVHYSGNFGGDPIDRTVNLSGPVPAASYNFTQVASTTSARFDLGQFSDVNVGTIANNGQATLQITSILPQPPAPVGGTYSRITSPGGSCGAAPFNLGAGASCTVWIRFTPTAAVTSAGIFQITPSPGVAENFTLTGTGTQPLISPTSSTLAFGNVQQGVPKPLNQVVTNTGTAPLTFTVNPSSPGALSGAGAADYAVTGTCTTVTPLTALGGTCNLIVTLTPTVLGPRPATLTISSDATNGPLVITLSGTGVALPEPTVTFPPTDFPDTVIGETSAQTRTITILNTRTRNITYSIAGTADFPIGAESCGAGRTVPGGGGTCTITVQFTPQLGAGEGHRQATLTLTFAGTGGDVAPNNQSGNVGGNALLPLSPSTASLNLSAVVGSPTTTAMLLTNRAATPITLSTLVFGGANPGDYSIDASSVCVPALVLAPSSACSLVIRFNPPTAGTRNATLTITHSALGSPQSVALQGTATPAPQGQIQLSSTTLTYADTQLGSTSAQSVTVRNSGNLALTFSAFTFGGAMPADFQRSGTCDTAAPLAIGAQCTLTVTFAPTALGLRTATLTIASDASNGAATITLSGNGVPVPAPQVSLNPTTLDFGTQTTGGIYPSRRVRLGNSGTADLAISSIVVAGSGFADVSAGPCPATLAPGAGCDIDIVFAATAAQSYSGTLTVTSNAAGSPHVTVLKGVGSAAAVAVLVWSPAVTQIDFGAVSAGSVSPIQSATLLNQGPGGVNLTVLNAIGADGASFAVVGGTCAIGVPLFQGDTCRVDFAFAPGSSGNKTATVQIASTGSFPPTLSLIGVGLAGPNPSLAMSASALAFESIRVGAQSLPQDVRLTSSGSGLVGIQSIDVTGPYAIQSTTCPVTPFSLQPGAECTISVSFRPNAEGASTGTLHIATDAAPVDRIVSLSGSAEAEPNLSNGGCSIAGGATLLDPTLWLLALLAAVALVQRQRRARPGPSGQRDGDKR